MERIWRASGLNRPKFERDDYRNKTIAVAIDNQVDGYDSRMTPRVTVAPTHKAHDDKDAEIAWLRDENAQLHDENAKLRSQRRDMSQIIHDGRIKDRDVRTALVCWSLSNSYPSDPDLKTREGAMVRMTDVGAVFGGKMSGESQRKKGSLAVRMAVELGLVTVEKCRNEHGHEDIYLKAGALPDKALTMEELKTTHRREDVVRHAEPRCKWCQSHKLLPTTWECETCGGQSTQAEALAAGFDYDPDQHAPRPVADSATLDSTRGGVGVGSNPVSDSATGRQTHPTHPCLTASPAPASPSLTETITTPDGRIVNLETGEYLDSPLLDTTGDARPARLLDAPRDPIASDDDAYASPADQPDQQVPPLAKKIALCPDCHYEVALGDVDELGLCDLCRCVRDLNSKVAGQQQGLLSNGKSVRYHPRYDH